MACAQWLYSVSIYVCVWCNTRFQQDGNDLCWDCDRQTAVHAGMDVVGGGGVQHWERTSCAAAASEDHGVLRAQREANWTAEEDVSTFLKGRMNHCHCKEDHLKMSAEAASYFMTCWSTIGLLKNCLQPLSNIVCFSMSSAPSLCGVHCSFTVDAFVFIISGPKINLAL